MIAPPDSVATAPMRFWIVGVTAMIVAGAFFATDHDVNISLQEGFSYSADHLSELTQGGNRIRQAAYLSLAGMGACLLLVSRSRPLHPDGLLFPLILSFVVWIGASVTWSTDPGITLRRLFVFGCCLTAALGLVRSLRPRELVLLACLVSTAFLAAGVATELVQGTFRPWSGDYRFAGTLHPNAQGMNLAVVCLSSCALWPGSRRCGWLCLAVLGTGLLFLLLTRSRTSAAGVLLGLVTLWSLRTTLPRMFVQGVFVSTCVLIVALFAAGLGGKATGEKIERTILLGRAENAGSLTGRVPLWNELMRYVVQRPLNGYGYDTFWTERHIRAVTASQDDWGVHEAHSSYMELLLNVGVIGLLLVVPAVLIALIASGVHFVRTQQAEFGFLHGLYLFAVINGITESGMTMPNFVPFIAASGLLLLALTPRPAVAVSLRRSPVWRACHVFAGREFT